MELKRLTSLRAFAALVVFGYHIEHHSSWMPFDRIFVHGFTGVAFFFVLSGFVLAWSTSPGTSAHDFWVRRVARVYPSHLTMAVVALIVPATAFAVTPLAVVANLLLVQAWFPQWNIVFGLNAVSWSLSCEAFFYLIAPFVISRARDMSSPRLVLAFGSWTLLAGLAAVTLGYASPALDIAAYTNPLVRSGEFVLGVMLAMLTKRGWRLPFGPFVGLLAIAGTEVALRLSTFPQSVVDAAFVLPFALLIAAAAQADIAGSRSLLWRRLFTYAGEVSFGFYLVHELVIINLVDAVGPGGGTSVGMAWVLVAFGLSTLSAVALHEGVEKPAQAIIRRRYLRRPALPGPT